MPPLPCNASRNSRAAGARGGAGSAQSPCERPVILHYSTLHYSAMQCITVHYSALQCITVHCSLPPSEWPVTAISSYAPGFARSSAASVRCSRVRTPLYASRKPEWTPPGSSRRRVCGASGASDSTATSRHQSRRDGAARQERAPFERARRGYFVCNTNFSSSGICHCL